MAGAGEVSKSSWVDIASDDSCVNVRELCEWLSIKSHRGLRALMETDETFPKPRFGKFNEGGKGGTPARWRVGDVRAWLRGSRPTTFQISDNPAKSWADRQRTRRQVRGDVEFVPNKR